MQPSFLQWGVSRKLFLHNTGTNRIAATLLRSIAAGTALHITLKQHIKVNTYTKNTEYDI